MSIRSRSRAGILSRARSARLPNLTSQSMKDVVEAARFSLREFLFRLVKRLEFAGQWFFGHWRQHNPTALARHFKLVAVMHIQLLPDVVGEHDGQFATAHRRLGHVILLVLRPDAPATAC